MQLDDVKRIFAACIRDASIFDRDVEGGSLFETDRIKKEKSDWLVIAAGVPGGEADSLFPNNPARADRATIPLNILGGGQASFCFVLRPLSTLPDRPAVFERMTCFAPGDKIPYVEMRQSYFRLSNMPGDDNRLNHLRWELDLTGAHQDPKEGWLHPWMKRICCNPGHPPSHMHFNAPPVDAEFADTGRSAPSS